MVFLHLSVQKVIMERYTSIYAKLWRRPLKYRRGKGTQRPTHEHFKPDGVSRGIIRVIKLHIKMERLSLSQDQLLNFILVGVMVLAVTFFEKVHRYHFQLLLCLKQKNSSQL